VFTAHFYILLRNRSDIKASHDVDPAFSLHLAYIRLHLFYIYRIIYVVYSTK